MNKNIQTYPTKTELVAALSLFLESETQNSGEFHLCLSGGSTPKQWFTYLADHYADKIPWGSIHFWWGDERCVPPDNLESNFGEAQRLLFDQVPVPSDHIHRVLGEKDPEAALLDYEREIREWVPFHQDIPVFDLMILGMGEDGHTASIFPNQMELLNADSICAVATHPQSGQKRITLTGPVINQAWKVVFLVAGASKAEKIAEIHGSSSSDKVYPAGLIQPVNGPAIWMLDQPAAQLLE